MILHFLCINNTLYRKRRLSLNSQKEAFIEEYCMKAKDIQIRLSGNLKRMRKSHKLTQFELAERADVSEDTVKSIELMRFWPSEKTLAQISSALNIDVYHFFMPTADTINTEKAVLKQLKETILKTYFTYIEDVLNELEKI